MEQKLKEALQAYYDQELSNLPSEEELAAKQQFSPEFERKMERIKKLSRRNYVSIAHLTVRRSSVAAILVIVLLASSMSVEAIRTPIVKFLLEGYETFSRIIFPPVAPTSEDSTFEYIMPAIPDDYSVVSEIKLDGFYNVELQSVDGENIRYSKQRLDSLTMDIDTEGITTEAIVINGFDGLRYSNKDVNNLIWNDGFCVFSLSGTCDFSLLEEMSKNIS